MSEFSAPSGSADASFTSSAVRQGRSTVSSHGWRLRAAIGLLLPLGCGDTAPHARPATTRDAGATPVMQCPTAVETAGPTASSQCDVSARTIEPMFTCGRADCAVTEVLDVTCETQPVEPSLAVTPDGALVLFESSASPLTTTSVGRLMSVRDGEYRVEDVASNLAVATTASGSPWLFGSEPGRISASRVSDAGWNSSTVATLPPDGTLTFWGASMSDDADGYVVFSDVTLIDHLLRWDGSCWSDQLIDAQATAMTLATDATQAPWLAWLGHLPTAEPIALDAGLYLRSPEGDVQELFASTADASPGMLGDLWPEVRLLPGGADGTESSPIVAAKFNAGLRLFRRTTTTDSDWVSFLLPESAAGQKSDGDCPAAAFTPNDSTDPCSGVTSCTEQVTGSSRGFDLARTRSGAAFAAWVNYSVTPTYQLSMQCRGGELPGCSCEKVPASGPGTAELVVARLTDAEPVLSHFRFDLGGPTFDPFSDVVLEARGDTLVLVASLGRKTPSLTYVELDSRLLP